MRCDVVHCKRIYYRHGKRIQIVCSTAINCTRRNASNIYYIVKRRVRIVNTCPDGIADGAASSCIYLKNIFSPTTNRVFIKRVKTYTIKKLGNNATRVIVFFPSSVNRFQEILFNTHARNRSLNIIHSRARENL